VAWNWRGWLTGAGAIPNTTVGAPPSVGPNYSPGDPDGVEMVDIGTPNEGRMAAFVPSPWDGWPASWASPQWGSGSVGSQLAPLVDVAWSALDLNTSVLSSMPVYRTRDGKVLEPTTWMTNPDPAIYTSWAEFAKQLFWDWQMGEAFVLPMARGADGWPMNFRVIPPWMMSVDMGGGGRVVKLGSMDVTNDVLHLRYKSTTDQPRGTGALEAAGARLIAAGVLARYASEIAQGGGIPKYVLETPQPLTPEQSQALLDQWWASRMANLGEPWKPAVLSGGVQAKPLQLSPQDMALMELAQYTEARITNMLGVPGFLLGLPGGDSMTYSNASSLFDFHDRRFLHPAATHVMTGMSGWVLPRGQSVELNRDEYSRPPLAERADAYAKLIPLKVMSAKEARTMERFTDDIDEDDQVAELDDQGDDDLVAAQALTGGGR
jgi:HK97 family phage portal protein